MVKIGGMEIDNTMSLEMLLLYLATWTLVALTPGPAVLCAMSQATRFGFRASLVGICGIQTGNLLFFVSVASGLAALLATATQAFTVLRWVGAAYLFYLGIRIIVGSFRSTDAKAETQPALRLSRRGLFLQGLLIQVTNPKALLFVSALFPQFLDAQRPLLPQLGILLVVTVTVDLLVLSGYACFADRGLRTFRTTRFAAWLERAFGAALVFFGVRLLVSRR
jgi:homoserine/homoserine lactone efflux protein